MTLVEIQETIKKKVTVIKKTIITPGIEAIIAIPKKGMKIQRSDKND